MEKLVLKGKKEIRQQLVDSLRQTVQALGLHKSKKKTEKLINKTTKRIAELVSGQMKKEMKIKEVKGKKEKKEKKVKPLKAIKTKKPKKIKESDLEIA